MRGQAQALRRNTGRTTPASFQFQPSINMLSPRTSFIFSSHDHHLSQIAGVDSKAQPEMKKENTPNYS
jgi:hypothetical protein